MGLFNRKGRQQSENSSTDDAEPKKEKGSWKRPANTAFKQQRLKAWQPILTPKTVLPTLFIIGILFAPIGGLLIWGSGKVTEITVDYTHCEDLTDSDFHDASSSRYRLSSSHSGATHTKPQYSYRPDQRQCVVRFDVPYDLDPTVLFYYKLTNFFQNHRRYVKSLNTDQLKGDHKTVGDLDDGDCKPLAKRKVDGEDKVIYPCGLIANSMFNDTFSSLTLLNAGSDQASTYEFTAKGIAWPGEAKKYVNADDLDYRPDEIVPPPNWVERIGNTYNETNIPNLRDDQHFQNWMRTAGLPEFTKLYGRNDDDKLVKGTYELTIDLRFPVKSYKGTKSIVISTVSWVGGKNPFLGWAYVAASALFVLLAILGTIRHLVRPRRLGDMSLLSWNR